MKKRRLFNRVGCAVIAILMALVMGVSPVATQNVFAGQNDDVTDNIAISVKQETLTFEEGAEYDIASYFTVTCENLAYLYGNSSQKYYSDVYSSDEGYEPIANALSISYSKVEGDGSETPLDSAPSKEGTYKAYAKFSEESYYAYDTNGDIIGYFWSEYQGTQYIESGSLQYTIKKEEADEEVASEGLQLLAGDENLPDKDAFILLMFGDGFTADQQKDFYKESKKIAKYIMETSPYDEFEDTIKIYAYGTASNESGARADKAKTQDEANADTRDTYFGSSYWTGGMQRLLNVDSKGLAKVETLKNEVLPETDFSVIVVNADTYGGSGGEVCVASLNSSSLEMMLHELGHTVADLADEYWAGVSYAAENVNMTKESDPEKVSWARFVGKNGVGVYKHEQTETSTDWYRPSDNCKMQYLRQSAPFCEVCKEALRKTFCKNSDVTKIFFQTYADEFYQTETGKDMKEYFIIRRGDNETTGDELGDKLTLVYKDAEGNIVDGIPSLAGDYTIEATFAGDSTYEACSMTAEYTIELPDLITITMADSKVYDGKPTDIDIKVDYDGEYTTSIYYTGIMPYTNYEDIPYDSDEAPIKPGKYTAEVKAYDKDGTLISKKSKSYQITYKVTQLENNNTGTYPGAQDWYNNKQIVIVGEGFTAEEQDKFEKVAQDYVDYILNTEPFKETKLYFNFTAVEVVSDESGIGTEAKNTYYKLRYDENGKILPENIQAIANVGYNNVSPYYRANIVIVNDENVTDGARTADENRGYIYGGLNENSKEYVARELLNYLTRHEEGYVAETKEDIDAQRTDLLRTLFYTWYGEDYAVIVSRAYDEIFVESEDPINMSDYFQTYILGKEVPKSELNYTFTYYDSEGNQLDSEPTTSGTYQVLAELIPSSDKQYASDNDGAVFWEVREDETIGDDGEVFDADGNSIGWLFTDPVTEVTMDGTNYYIPRARAISTFRIVKSVKDSIKTTQDYLDAAKEAISEGDTDEAQKYLELAKAMMEDGELADVKNNEERLAIEEALEQVTQALKKSEEDKAAAQKALEKAEEALKEAEAAKKEAELAKQDAANQVAKAKFNAKKASLKSVKSSKKKTLKATWKTVSGAEGYEIQYSKKSNFKSAKTVTVKGASKKTTTIKKLSSKKKYYVRVRAYKTIDGKKVYSSWSTKKSVRVK